MQTVILEIKLKSLQIKGEYASSYEINKQIGEALGEMQKNWKRRDFRE